MDVDIISYNKWKRHETYEYKKIKNQNNKINNILDN